MWNRDRGQIHQTWVTALSPPEFLGAPVTSTLFLPCPKNIGLCFLGNPSGERCGKTCVEERDNQWLGVSLSRQPKENGSMVVCINHWVCMSVCQTAITFLRFPCQMLCLFYIHRLVDIDGKMCFMWKVNTNCHMVFVLPSLLIFELNWAEEYAHAI